MPRGSTTQTRTFNYTTSNVVGGFLLSATNPENGAVTYTYNPTSNTLASKTDAKSQELTYQYDIYNRLTSVTWANAAGGAQVLRTFTYDTATNGLGRLAGVTYAAVGTVQMSESYSYVAAGTAGGGLPASKLIGVTEPYEYQNANGDYEHVNLGGAVGVSYTYNGFGKITAVTYPSTVATGGTVTAGPAYNYSYDSMYRLSGMTQTTPATTIVSNVSYNAANQLLTMNYPAYEETRSYNTLGQLTNLNVENSSYASVENLTYNYPSGTNNGKVSSMLNSVSGETTTYTYDSLNRLFTASGSGWGQQYGFDGFGNLESKTVTSGSGPSMSLSVNPANNRIEGVSGYTYDANGNMSLGTGTLAYDVENRISYAYAGPTSEAYYAYDSQNRRVLSWPGAEDSLGNATGYTVNMYAPTGQKLGAYVFTPGVGPGNLPYIGITLVSSDQYFGSRRIAVLDQLGSAGTYYPWGEDRGTTNPQDTWSFATYWTDSVSGLDYANNRYYFNSLGRFMTPDPAGQAAASPQNPQGWNRYAYVAGDPVNYNDPTGQEVCDPDYGCYGPDGFGDGSDGGYCDPSQASCGNPCFEIDGFTPTPGPYCQEAGGPAPAPAPPPPPPPPIYCEPDVIAAMKASWAESANGTSGREAGFSVNGTPASYRITSTGAYSTSVPCTATISITAATFAVFHVHPNACQPQPSPTDINAADNGGFDIYTFSKSGLWEYDPATGASIMLRSGMSWDQPCPAN